MKMMMMKIKQTTRREYLFLLTATTAAAIFIVAFLGVVDVVNSFSNTNNHHHHYHCRDGISRITALSSASKLYSNTPSAGSAGPGSSTSASESSTSTSTSSQSKANAKSKSKASLFFARNEFSRIIHIDRIFQNKRRTLNQQQRDHDVAVKADSTERTTLAKRFQLKQLSKLEAELVFRPAITSLSSSSSSYATSVPIAAEGIIMAQLVQTCVRTGEDFEVDVEIPVNAIIRPVQSMVDNTNNDQHIADDDDDSSNNTYDDSSNSGSKGKNKNNKKNKKNVFHRNKKVHNLDDIFDLQQAIEQAELYEGNGSTGGGINGRSNDYTAQPDIVEDENIYSLSSDQLDVGELVSQTFYLQLDWYPSKPGITEPMEFDSRDYI